MFRNHAIQHSLTVGVLLLFVLELFLPITNVGAYTINPGDGIWSDTFDDRNSTISLNNNTVWQGTQNVDGTILLKSNNSALDYTYAKDSLNQAYWSRGTILSNPNFTRFFVYWMPSVLLNTYMINNRYSKNSFDPDFDIPLIRARDTNYKNISSTLFERYVTLHFRIKLDVPAEKIENLIISWYGKARTDANIKLYFWGINPDRKLDFLKRPTWQYLTTKKVSSSASDTTLTYNLSTSEIQPVLDEDNYCDILVTADSYLSTNFIDVRLLAGAGYVRAYGLVQTAGFISPRAISGVPFYWDLLTWEDFENNGAAVHYQVCYVDDDDQTVLVPDDILKGNEEGFTTSPVSISILSRYGDTYQKLKIRANLTTTNPFITPKIYSWALTWQTKLDRWQDSFNSTYRLDVQNNINVDTTTGTVNISYISGDWPTFGQNPTNTRVFNGPGARTLDLYWYSTAQQDQHIHDPVIAGDALYFCADDSTGSSTLYRYSPIVVPEEFVRDLYPSSFIKEYHLDESNIIVGAPAVTDKYLVVATGSTVDNVGGHPRNYVYAFDKNSPSSSFKWKFSFTNENGVEQDICYWGSPVVVDNKVFISGWDGHDYLHVNEPYVGWLVVYDLTTGGMLWSKELPAWSFSTPAISNGTVFIGCKNKNDDSFFALNEETGDVLWNASLGSVGKSAPVIGNNTVFIVSEEKLIDGIPRRTKVTALDISNGRVLWEHENGRITTDIPEVIFTRTFSLADATPAYYNNILYITSPDGYVLALNAYDGSKLWQQHKYTKIIPTKPVLLSSPAYADGIVYIGTPSGFLYALDATNNGEQLWQRQMQPSDQTIPVATSPIVSNGLVFIAGDNGWFYSFGIYVSPKKALSGTLVSVPITLPPDRWWGNFYADYNTTRGSLVFSILDESGDKTLKANIKNGNPVTYGNQSFGNVIRLRANLSAANLTVNPSLYRWYVTFVTDGSDPVFNESTFQPPSKGWLNKTVSKYPRFSIQVKDKDTGLNISSARYTLGYVVDNESYTKTFTAFCSGTRGTTAIQNMSANLSALDFYANISTLESFQFSISDLAGNIGLYPLTPLIFKHDLQNPISYLTGTYKSRYNTSFKVSAKSRDIGIRNVNASGIQTVSLYFRRSATSNVTGPWILYNTSKKINPTWTFDYTLGSGGYYELWTIAVDNASNTQAFPAQHSNVSFIYDVKKPNLPDISGDIVWFNERPNFTVDFSDDFLLSTIKYRLDFHTNWTVLATQINKQSYEADWQIPQSDWDSMKDNTTYYMYFWINDTLNNVRVINDISHAIHVRKDNLKPTVEIQLPSSDTVWSTSSLINITAIVSDRNGSGIERVTLYYHFSEDDMTWSEWAQFGEVLTESPYKWQFTSPMGNGYYEFKITAEDRAGNIAESAVVSSGVNAFPGTLILIMIGLIAGLVVISSIIVLKWRKKKE